METNSVAGPDTISLPTGTYTIATSGTEVDTPAIRDFDINNAHQQQRGFQPDSDVEIGQCRRSGPDGNALDTGYSALEMVSNGNWRLNHPEASQG